MQNSYIYFLFLLYLAPAGWWMLRRSFSRFDPFKVYLALLLPAFLLVIVGVAVAIRQVPKNKIVVHGYSTPLDSKRHFRIGSDTGFDDICFNSRFKSQEQISAGILDISFGPEKGRADFLLTQTDPFSPNVVTVGGLPLRSLEISPGQEHQISFGMFDFATDEKHVLKVSIQGNRPVFQYQDLEFSAGFTRELLWGLISIPYENGRSRHLAFGNRLRFPGLPYGAGELLKQAAILRHEGRYYLVANDADIRLDDRPFPSSMGVVGGTEIRLATRELGDGRRSVSFKIYPPSSDGDRAGIRLSDEDKKIVLLERDLEAERICFTANESYFSNTLDIRDPQFPTAGLVVNREGQDFVFRGEILTSNRMYQAGKAVFSIDSISRTQLLAVAWFGLLFLAAALLVPPGSIRRQPLIAIVISACVFLLAFRQLLAFRAWQGPPFKFSILMDSLTAPYIFMLIILAVAARYNLSSILLHYWTLVRNFFRPRNRRPLPAVDRSSNGPYLIALCLYGILIFLLFRDRPGWMFLGLILMWGLVSVLIKGLDVVENRIVYYSSAGSGLARWRPALVVLPLMVLLTLAAPSLGGKEVISILPGRPRPDIFVQLFLLFMVAYIASVWVKEARHHVPNPIFILITLLFPILVPFIQGVFSEDMGFFVMVALPLFLVMLCATWKLDARIRLLVALAGLAGLVAFFFLINSNLLSLEPVSMRRIAFFLDKTRMKSEYFFDYLAHLPILWSSGQGLTGGGFFQGDFYSALSETSVNDNVASVFIQGELGTLGTILTMTVFGLLSTAGILYVSENRERLGGFRIWFLFGISLMLIWTAATMILANLGHFPLTGKNLPFLGIDSMNDVIRYGLLIGFMVRYMDKEY